MGKFFTEKYIEDFFSAKQSGSMSLMNKVIADVSNDVSKAINDAICPFDSAEAPFIIAQLERYAKHIREIEPEYSRMADRYLKFAKNYTIRIDKMTK